MTTIQNRDELARSPAHELALDCLAAGIEAASPEGAVRRHLSVDGDTLTIDGATYDLTEYDEILVLGGGKASAGLAAALESLLPVDGGVVVTDTPRETDVVEVIEGDHPVPSERGMAGARDVLAHAENADERTLVLAAITGGGSALLPAPVEGITLAALRDVTEALLESGAAIDEINAVRKHLSAIKGGGLARTAAPATVVGLLMSDVVGDDAGVIASGPTAPDPTTYEEALAVLDRYAIDAPDVRAHLECGAAGDLAETPKPDDPVFDRVQNHVIANAETALAAARERAQERGYQPLTLSSRVRGEAREAGLFNLAIAEECLNTGMPVEPPAVLLSGGETTVTVRGDGRGGPNQEFALRAAMELPEDAVVAAVDTDGRDGSTDAAGALVDSETVEDLDVARRALASNDTQPYLEERNAFVKTGRTGTNVNDLRVVVLG